MTQKYEFADDTFQFFALRQNKADEEKQNDCYQDFQIEKQQSNSNNIQDRWIKANTKLIQKDKVLDDSFYDVTQLIFVDQAQISQMLLNPLDSITFKESSNYDQSKARIKTQSSVNSISNSSLIDEIQNIPIEQVNSQKNLMNQGSILMEQGSVLMSQSSVLCPQSSVTLPQGSNLISSLISPIKKEDSQCTNPSINFVSQSQAELRRLQTEKSIRRSSHLDVLTQRSLIPIFSPLELQVSNQIKIKQLKQEEVKRIITISLIGASFGRGDLNTIQLLQQTRVSVRHAKIIFFEDKFAIQDQGSKRGTFVKIYQKFQVCEQMCFFIGDKFAFKIHQIIIESEEEGELKLSLDKDSDDQIYSFKLKKGEVWGLGRDKKKNNYSLEGYPCLPLMSSKHLNISYQLDWKTGLPFFCMDDLSSRNGTWLRLSDKLSKSQPIHLQRNSRFNFAFEVFFEVIEIFYDL